MLPAKFAVNSASQILEYTPRSPELCKSGGEPAHNRIKKLQLTLNLLGRFEAFDGNSDAPLVFPRKKAAALLAFLAMSAGRPKSREDVAELFWGYTNDAGVRASLRQTLLVIRKMLPGLRGLEVMPNSLVFLPDYLNIDVSKFELAANEASFGALERAAALYTGAFLQGFSVRAEGFERWRAGEAARLQDIGLSVFERLMTEYMANDRQADAVTTAYRTLSVDSLHEVAHQTLIRVYAAQGRNGLARQQYDACRDQLARELSLSPSRETERIYSTLLGSKKRGSSAAGQGFRRTNYYPQFPHCAGRRGPAVRIFGRCSADVGGNTHTV